MTIISRQSSFFRPMYADEHQLQGIRIYKDGEILYSNNSGWFESGRRDVTAIELPSLRRRLKHDLISTDPYILKEKYADWTNEKGYVLYIHADLVQFQELGESVDYTTDEATHYKRECIITLPCSMIRLLTTESPARDEVIERTLTLTYGWRAENTDFGNEVNRVHKELEEARITITTYDLRELIKLYTLTKKED